MKIDKEIMQLGAVITGIIGITVIECYALSQGINGVAMATSIAGIAGCCGYIFKSVKK